jgi:acetyl-CoA carboxylase biotin carboxylase subunit
MFKKILIANRGEIAVRVIRACREMGITTVAVYSEIDKEALHTQMADEAICIGPAASKDSYLNIQNILSATVLSGAEAIHPGFGFLSENSKFAKMCNECNITFIGPDFESIEKMGNKSRAREIMEGAGVPVVPGSEGALKNIDEAREMAEKIGYPVMIKAAAGGGGRGIRIVNEESELLNAFNTAKAEAKACFADDSLYMEKFVKDPHHIEFQIIADNFGNTVYLGERDCSIQRRNQKVLEEAPSMLLTEEVRKKMGEIAVKAAKAVNYKNAGTIEFLVDDNLNFYFMEMNTRIQVEHPITEMITGVDLIKEQIKVAAGEKLSFSQEDVELSGHAIECRINAENPEKDFRPSPGKILQLNVPGGLGVRLDSAVYQGYTIPPTYDSMIGKLIVHAKNRDEAIARMRRALEEFVIDGLDTNLEFQLHIINDKDFAAGNYNTGFLKDKLVNGKWR